MTSLRTEGQAAAPSPPRPRPLVVRPLPAAPAGRKTPQPPPLRQQRRQAAFAQLESDPAKTAILALQGTAQSLKRIDCHADAAHALIVALRLALRWQVTVALGKQPAANAPIVELAGKLRSAGALTRQRMRAINTVATIGKAVATEQLAELTSIVRETVEQLAYESSATSTS